MTPLKVLSLGFQKEIHDQVSAIRRITKFNWSMVKWKILINQLLDDNSRWLTHYSKLLKDMELTENGDNMYQDLPQTDLTKLRVQSSFHMIKSLLAWLFQWNEDSKLL